MEPDGRNLIGMDKRSLSERDICTQFITPALRRAGWDEMLQIREEVSFTKGRLIVRGKLVTRGQGKRADYILYCKPNIPIALIKAKRTSVRCLAATGSVCRSGGFRTFAAVAHQPSRFVKTGHSDTTKDIVCNRADEVPRRSEEALTWVTSGPTIRFNTSKS
jgi:hypothetical protein